MKLMKGLMAIAASWLCLASRRWHWRGAIAEPHPGSTTLVQSTLRATRGITRTALALPTRATPTATAELVTITASMGTKPWL